MYDGEHESDYEDAEDEIFSHSFKPSYVVIAIDSHPMMFQKNENDVMPFRSCLEACYNLADSLLFFKDKRSWSPFAVMIAGQSSPLITFDKNVLESIKVLKGKMLLSDDDLINEFQRKDSLDLGNFFLTCKKIFYEIRSVFYKRSVIYLSNNDNPVNDKNAKFTALNEIKTFSTSEINFEVVPTIDTFNYKLFYNELFTVLGTVHREDICTDTEGLTQKLNSTVLLKVNERKVIFFPFKGDTKRFMKCRKINIFHTVILINNSMTTTGDRVVNTNETGDSLPSFKIKYLSNEKGENVSIDPIEKASFQNFSLPKGYTLLYIADRQVPLGYIHTKPTLIKSDPKEEVNYFNQFWDNCVKTNKVLVCISKIKQPDKIKYCELIPILVNDTQMFLEKRLPYANEIMLPYKKMYPDEEVDSDRKQAVANLVKALTLDFDPKMIQDAPYENKKAYVKAKLLNEPMEEVEIIDFNPQHLDAVLDDVVGNIKSKFVLEDAVAKKRKAPPAANTGNRKKKIDQK